MCLPLQASASTSEQLKIDILSMQKYLSPSVIGAIVNKSSALHMRRQLIRAYAELKADDLARLFAVAFIKSPGETLVAGASPSGRIDSLLHTTRCFTPLEHACLSSTGRICSAHDAHHAPPVRTTLPPNHPPLRSPDACA